MQAGALVRIREEFESRRDLSDPEEISGALDMVGEAIVFMRQNMVQLEHAPTDDDPDAFKATLHSDVELGDDLVAAAQAEGVPFPKDCKEYAASLSALGGDHSEVSFSQVARKAAEMRDLAADSSKPSIRDLRAARSARNA